MQSKKEDEMKKRLPTILAVIPVFIFSLVLFAQGEKFHAQRLNGAPGYDQSKTGMLEISCGSGCTKPEGGCANDCCQSCHDRHVACQTGCMDDYEKCGKTDQCSNVENKCINDCFDAWQTCFHACPK
jgi:hypothetical protein